MAEDQSDGIPNYVAIASSGERAVWVEHVDSFDAAVAWCEQMRLSLAGKVHQLAVAQVKTIHWLRLGETPVLAPAVGWQWINGTWQEVDPSELDLKFKTFLGRGEWEREVERQQDLSSALATCDAYVAAFATSMTNFASALQTYRHLTRALGQFQRVLLVHPVRE